ncbi:hypothetical protein BGZ94_007035 [Podila epigama]|nr:hypothetical protein BGZ94_007035 [Podila epigama]
MLLPPRPQRHPENTRVSRLPSTQAYSTSPLHRYIVYLFDAFRELENETSIEGIASNRKRFLSTYSDMLNERVGFKDMSGIALLQGAKVLEEQHVRKVLEVASTLRRSDIDDPQNGCESNPTATSAPPCSNPKNRRKLKQHYTTVLVDWIRNHKSHPFPTKDEKTRLCKLASISETQLNNWFTNYRRRHLK